METNELAEQYQAAEKELLKLIEAVDRTLYSSHCCAIVSLWEKQSKDIFQEARFLAFFR